MTSSEWKAYHALSVMGRDCKPREVEVYVDDPEIGKAYKFHPEIGVCIVPFVVAQDYATEVQPEIV